MRLPRDLTVNLSVKRQLELIVISTCGLAVILVGGSFLIIELLIGDCFLARMSAAVISVLTTSLVARPLYQRISRPIQELVRVTRTVSQKRGYASRARRLADGELGAL